MIKGPPEFPKKSWRPPWIFSAVSHLYLWSEKSPPENTKAMESAPLNLWRHFLSPPENEKAILMPPWILRRKTERRIHSKTAIFNRSIQGGLAHQKCYARVQPGYSVGGDKLNSTPINSPVNLLHPSAQLWACEEMISTQFRPIAHCVLAEL